MPLTASIARPVFVVGLLVLFAVVGVQHIHKISKPVARDDDQLTRSAILRWMPQLKAMRDGKNPYTLYNYPNPPIMGLLLMPLTYLSPVQVATVWFVLKVGLAFASVWLAFRLVEVPSRPFPDWAKALAALLVLRFIVTDLQHGNINLWILFLVVAALSWLRSGRDVFAGLTLGLAIACKVTPALFVPYLVWKRAWWALGGTLLGLVVFLYAMPGLILGEERNRELLQSWYGVMVQPFANGQVTPEHQNQSLPGLVTRLGTSKPAFSTYIPDENGVDVYTPQTYHTISDIGPTAANWLVKGLLLTFAGVVVWSCRTPFGAPRSRADWRLAAEYGLILTGMLLFSERTWKHHAVTLVVPAVVLCYAWSTLPLSRLARWSVGGILSVWAVLLLGVNEAFLGDHGFDMAMVYGVFTVLFALIGVGMVVVVRASLQNEAAVTSEAELNLPALAA